MVPTPPAGVRERGYAVADPWDLSNGETATEMVWPLAGMVFNRMRKDAQVKSVLMGVKSPIQRTQWRVDGTGCREEVTRSIADSLGLPIVDDEQPDTSRARLRGRTRFLWGNHLRHALLCLDFGNSYAEQVYYPPNDEGLYTLRKLGERHPLSISHIEVARDGGLKWIEQHGFMGRASRLPVNRLVAYVLDKESGNWYGESLLRSAFKNWRLKDEGLRKWLTGIDRNAVGIPIYEAADGEEDLARGLSIAQNIRSGDMSGAAIPNGAKLTIQGVEGALADVDKFVRYNDEQIARSALGHFLNLGSQAGNQVGSYNLGSVFADTFHLGLDAIAAFIADTASAHIVEDLVDLNFGPTEPAPQIVYDEVGTRMSELDRVREAAGLASDADLVRFLRREPAQPSQTQEAS